MDYKELFTRMQRTDWTYMMSDDNSVYRRGTAAMNALRSEVSGDATAEQMFADFYQHVWHRGPQPKLEDYIDG
ncbi:hypothetical protein PQB35_gp18 [Ochrobactrum phage vB_OspP_OH]|uniref:Uncharacterized protein n=1 Tax=Ochrobactrum phage vB_OspP_OH TaxID=2712957 RepID=A0A6G6XXL8_9CAUD|nr:hypothetical protein PQB35_gp18 [Ochrobactrum phage vB_OspP_OH]QIG66074.1 hypothetical protein phiOH_p18 [Ochrobactrum phage vB_OspP_OH]